MVFHRLVFNALLVGACGYAAASGGKPERIAAAAVALATPLSGMLALLTLRRFQAFEWGIAGVDATLLLVLVYLALRSTRFWPMLMAALQGASILAHLAMPLAVHGKGQAYAATSIGPAYAILLLLIVAVRRHQGRLRRYGWDPAWVRDLPAAYLRGCTAHDARITDDQHR